MTDKLHSFKDVKESYEDIVVGHKFELTDAGRSSFHCAFCGGHGVKWFEITRDDKKKYKVGGTCIGRVGVSDVPRLLKEKTMAKGKQKPQVKKPPKHVPKVTVEEIEELPVEEGYDPDAIDDFIDSLKDK